jgi:hypothetical protein
MTVVICDLSVLRVRLTRSYSDRRKFRISCFCDVVSAVKFESAPFASDRYSNAR